ncbi:MAG: ParB N-terminal domain-containing protein [Phycisphaerae bacterium]|nr:ParB N-terminal domain-containing protein [Phycisphaerae bacterium]
MSEQNPTNVKGIDVPIVKLTPLRKRKVSKKNYNTLMANLKAVGLIEPLCVCQEGEQYFILDGYIRYTALLELGVETVPCLVLPSRDLYTPNRQVNHLSPQQEVGMLRKALEKLDESTIAEAFGVDSVKSRLHTQLYRSLHKEVAAELKSGALMQSVARELTYVVPKRQLEILRLMQESGDCSLAFAKAQVLATEAGQRSKSKRKRNPWQRGQKTKRDLSKKLAEVEKHYDFYSALYRQYVGDLLKLAIYVRQIVTRPKLRDYLAEHHAEDLEFFESVLAESEGKATG